MKGLFDRHSYDSIVKDNRKSNERVRELEKALNEKCKLMKVVTHNYCGINTSYEPLNNEELDNFMDDEYKKTEEFLQRQKERYKKMSVWEFIKLKYKKEL